MKHAYPYSPHRPPHRPSRRGGNNQGILAWLGNDTVAAGVLATARRHMQIRQTIKAALPAGLGDTCQVVKADSTCVTLAVPNAAHAAKLRQLAPRLAATLARAGWAVQEIKVRIQTNLTELPSYTPPPKEATALDAQALGAFAALRAQLQPGPLADAVSRLLTHHGAEVKTQ